MSNPTLSSGMSATGQPVPAGTELDVLSGGLSISTGIAGTEILSGGTDSSGTVQAGGQQVVSAGGHALSDVVNAGGVQTISSGGSAGSNMVAGTETVLPGGTTTGTILAVGSGTFGATLETVSGTASFTMVGGGGQLVVAAGGLATGATVSAFGQLTVQAGASVSDDTVLARGSETLLGTDSAGVMGGSETVSAGGSVQGGTLAASGLQTVLAGASVSGETVSGTLDLGGGSASSVMVRGTGALVVAAGGSTVGTVLASGVHGIANEAVLAGGTATGTVISATAELLVSGGSVFGTIVQSGGVQSLGPAGAALDDSVANGGSVVDDATLTFDEAAGPVTSFDGALSGSGTLVQDGDGTLLMAGSALAAFTGAIVLSAGTLELASGTVSPATVVFAGGALVVDGDPPTGVISGFSAGNAIDLTGLPYASGGYTVTTTNGTAILMSGDQPVDFADGSTATLNISGANTLLLAAESDGAGGTLLASLAETGADLYGGVTSTLTIYDDGAWGFMEAAGTSVTYSDGGNSTNLGGGGELGVSYPPALLPISAIIQSGPGTLVLPPSELNSFFDGTVLIDGGTVEITEPAGDGVTGFSFVGGTSGTLDVQGITEQPIYNPNGGSPNYAAATALTPISAVFPGDVVDLAFVPYGGTDMGLFVTSTGVTVTLGGRPIVVPNNSPVATSGTTLTLPITSANSYVYSLTSDGQHGTDLTVVGVTSGTVLPPGSTISGDVAETITSYGDGNIEVTGGGGLPNTVALPNGGLVIHSGPGTLSVLGGVGGDTLVIDGGAVDLENGAPVPDNPSIDYPVGYSGGPIDFVAGVPGTLILGGPVLPQGIPSQLPISTITGFAPGDLISGDFKIEDSTSGPLGISVSGDVVTITADGAPLMGGYFSLNIAGASSLPLTISGSAGDFRGAFNLSVACYARDTLVLTDTGERPVQDLAIGDRVVTVSRQIQPVRWIGRRSYAGRFLAARQASLAPILIRAGALGEGLPRRDLRVSPCHAMLLEGVLVPARCLVNGTSIVRDRSCSDIEYFHIELAQHDAIWAEGAASETFIDDGSRGLFHNAAEYASLYPNDVAAGDMVAPRVESGYQLEAIRARLAAKALLARPA